MQFINLLKKAIPAIIERIFRFPAYRAFKLCPAYANNVFALVKHKPVILSQNSFH